MKLAWLLSISGGVCFRRRKANPFRLAGIEPLPFLVSTRPLNLAPVCPALEVTDAAQERAQDGGWAGKAEKIILKSAAIVFVIVLLACILGAQRIAYVRARNQLGRELAQREHELFTITRAYWSLESEKALQVAQGFPLSEPRWAQDRPALRASAPNAVRTAAQQAAGSRAVVSRLAGQRPQIAGTKGPARRGGVRG